jgi:hypothetical protein
MSQKKSQQDIPMWAKLGHGRPITRRELLSAGALSFSAAMFVPSWLNSILPKAAAADLTCSNGASLIPFITLNLSGGAALQANYIPQDQGGQLLPSYNILGLGSTSTLPIEKEFGKVPFAGQVNGRLISQFLQGMRSAAPTALSNTAFVSICARSRDDTAANKFSVDGLLAKAGLGGSLLPNLGSTASATGITQDASLVIPPTPLRVNSFNQLTSSLGYNSNLQTLNTQQQLSLAKLVSRLSETQSRKIASIAGGAEAKAVLDCAGIKNESVLKRGSDAVDPRQDMRAGTKLQTIWNINANTNVTSQDLVFSSMVYNALTSQAGSVALELGGYDYHDNTRSTGDSKDFNAGQTVGRILESAAALGKPLFLYICSDGSLVSADSTSSTAPWTADSGTSGMAYMLYFNPSARPATSGFQIGQFLPGQVVDESTPFGNAPELAAAVVFANYLKVNNVLGSFDALTSRILTPSTLDQVVKFT